MAFKHGHGYTSMYSGLDKSAQGEFTRLTDFAREVETTIGYAAGIPVPYDGAINPLIGITFGTRRIQFANPRITTRDCSLTNSNTQFSVRYGGIYSVFVQGVISPEHLTVPGTPTSLVLKFYIGDVADPDQTTLLIPDLESYYFHIGGVFRLADGDTLDIRIRNPAGTASAVYISEHRFSIRGNRL